MRLFSTAFSHNGKIPEVYTCDESGVSPPLEIEGVPDEAESLTLIMEDPDVPFHIRRDGVWNHWVVFNIPPDTEFIEEGKEPPGLPGKGTSGETGYHGPCPPDREHRYIFRLYALNKKLDLPEGATKTKIQAAMEGCVLAKAELTGRYKRKI